MERRGEDHRDETDGSENSRLSMTERLMENIRKYAPELEISREATEIEMRIGHHTSAEYARAAQSSSSSDSNDEVASDSVNEEDRVTSTESLNDQEAMRGHQIISGISQNAELGWGRVPPSSVTIDSEEWDVVYVDDRIKLEGVGDPDINPLSSTELTVRVIGNRKFYLRRRIDSDTVLASDSPKSEPTCETSKELQETQGSVLDKVADSRTNEKVVKPVQTTHFGWWNLWGIFSRTPKVYPSSILQDVEAVVPESLPKIGATESDPIPTEPEVSQRDLCISLVDDAEFVRQNVEASLEWYDCDDADQNADTVHDRECVMTNSEGESQRESRRILESLPYLPGYFTPLEDTPEPTRYLTPETSGHENRGLENLKNASPNVSLPKSRKQKKSYRTKASSPVQDSSDTHEVISPDSLILTSSEVKTPGIVESLRNETEGQVVPLHVLFQAKPQILIEGEESDEDPELFRDDESSFPTGDYVPPVLSDSVVLSFSAGSVLARDRTFLRRNFSIGGPKSEAEPPRSRWKIFFGKKNKKKHKVAKMAEQKSPDEPGGRKRTTWFGGLQRTVRERWNKITRSKRASVDPTINPEQTTAIDEVSKATSSALRTKSKSEPILGKSSKSTSKSKVKRWSFRK